MPTYEYVCAENGHRFDVFQRIGEDPVTSCPECGSEVRKVFHPVGVVLKGSGFYKTDSRKKDAPKKQPEPAKKEEPKKASEGSTKKPDGKKESA